MTDTDVNCAYYLFHNHSWQPEIYINASEKKKTVYRAFIRQDLEDTKEELLSMQNLGGE